MPRLILLTNAYPRQHGDAVFVESEIHALSRTFDEVVVFSATAPDEPLVDLPPGVRFGGSLHGGGRRAILRGIRSREARRVARAVLRQERHVRRTRDQRRADLLACLYAMKVATDPRLRAELSDETVVYGFWGMGAGLALPWLAASVAGTAVRLHSYDLYEESRHLPFRTAMFNSVDVVLPVSDHGARYLTARYPAFAERIRVSRLGTFAFEPVARRPRGDGSVHVLSVSSVIPRKRVDLILAAVAQLARTRSVEWTHLGGGEGLEQLTRDAAAVMAAVPGLTVTLMGHQSHADVIRFYRDQPVDVFVNASTIEGVPVSIMEALALGVPVVASDAGGTSELVSQVRGSGVLVPADADERAIADALTQILDAAPGTLTPRAVWEQYCDSEQLSAELAKTLRSLTPRAASGRAPRVGASRESH